MLIELTSGAVPLICLPFAGGGTSAYRQWDLPGVAVHAAALPSREHRFGEEPFRDLTKLVNALVPAVAPLTRHPYAIFGHSMGSLIGYELARALKQRGLPEPEVLMASGHNAPDLPGRDEQLHLLPDARLVDKLHYYGATPKEMLARQDVLEVFLPTIRADFAVVETYRHEPGPALSCPITVFRGDRDPDVTAEGCARWAALTSGEWAAHCLPGDHFFVNESRHELLRLVAGQLDNARNRATTTHA